MVITPIALILGQSQCEHGCSDKLSNKIILNYLLALTNWLGKMRLHEEPPCPGLLSFIKIVNTAQYNLKWGLQVLKDTYMRLNW